MAPIRVLVAASDELGLGGLTTLLGSEPNMQVVGGAVNSSEVIAQCRALLPDVLVLDLHMVDQAGCRTLKAVRDQLPRTRVIVLSTRDHPEDLVCARSAGAHGYLLKDELRGRLVAAVCEVHAGWTYFPGQNTTERSLA